MTQAAANRFPEPLMRDLAFILALNEAPSMPTPRASPLSRLPQSAAAATSIGFAATTALIAGATLVVLNYWPMMRNRDDGITSAAASGPPVGSASEQRPQPYGGPQKAPSMPAPVTLADGRGSTPTVSSNAQIGTPDERMTVALTLRDRATLLNRPSLKLRKAEARARPTPLVGTGSPRLDVTRLAEAGSTRTDDEQQAPGSATTVGKSNGLVADTGSLPGSVSVSDGQAIWDRDVNGTAARSRSERRDAQDAILALRRQL